MDSAIGRPERRRLGATGLYVSPVGMGTCQLRLQPRERAMATLHAARQAGVNIFHTSPDYEGAMELTLEAMLGEEVDRPIILHQGYGPMPHFRHLYQQALASEPSGRLPLFGIACVEDREAVGEDVFGPTGMIAFLQQEKAAGRLGAIFCTTHAGPEGMRRYMEMGCFQAMMIAYNPLGFHLLTYNGAGQREFENMERIREEIFPLALRLDIGLMIMKPLAGGLLAKGIAFPPVGEVRPEMPWTARQVLEWILREPAVSCVIPGMAHPDEVWQNVTPTTKAAGPIAGLTTLQRTLCSRCGVCDGLCSQKLPVSWLFRDGYVQLYPSETFETPAEMRFERLHPGDVTACCNCTNQTCSCPQGLDIPRELPKLHAQWRAARSECVVGTWDGCDAVEVLEAHIPVRVGGVAWVRLQNRGAIAWGTGVGYVRGPWGEAQATLRHKVHRNETTHLCWQLDASAGCSEGGEVAFSWNGGPPVPIGSWQAIDAV